MIRTVRIGSEIRIGSITVEIKDIDPQAKRVIVDITTTEHITITKAQSEPTTR